MCSSDLLEARPDPAVVANEALRRQIVESGFPWRVRDNLANIEMVLVPSWIYAMGCSSSSIASCEDDELPVHEVALTQPFYIGRYEVTQAQWTAIMGSNPAMLQSPSKQVPASAVPNRPVESVSWNMVQGFLAATRLRLPTEAEWEHAYRAATTTAFHASPASPNGTNDESALGDIAWFSDTSGRQTRPVGQGVAANG